MNDKLSELRNGAASPDDVAISVDNNDLKGKISLVSSALVFYFSSHLNLGPADGNPPTQDSKFMQEYFSAVEIIKQNILTIRTATKQIGDINQQVFLLLNKLIINTFLLVTYKP